ncbi:DegV family protein [Streptococcus sp. DD11]|nr:DegV family protein [Streptococcus sp. DD11]
MTWKIVADSGCDYRQIAELAQETTFESVPLTLQVGNEIFVDDEKLNIDLLMEKMYAASAASKSACPSPDDYLRSFEGADHIFAVTITGTLSGSHNSAQVAKKTLSGRAS